MRERFHDEGARHFPETVEVQQRHKDVSIITHHSDNFFITLLRNGNHLLNYYDISLLLLCFKIRTGNDKAFVDFCWNWMAPSNY
jgi:hypothetical protein